MTLAWPTRVTARAPRSAPIVAIASKVTAPAWLSCWTVFGGPEPGSGGASLKKIERMPERREEPPRGADPNSGSATSRSLSTTRRNNATERMIAIWFSIIE